MPYLAGSNLDVLLGDVQPPGKRRMPATDWARGLQNAGPDAAGVPPPPLPSSARRRRRWPTVFGVVVVLLVAAVVIAGHISVNDYVITPGDASPVAPYIHVPAADNHPLTGTILLTDVYVTQLNALNYLQYKYFDSNSEVISNSWPSRRPIETS